MDKITNCKNCIMESKSFDELKSTLPSNPRGSILENKNYYNSSASMVTTINQELNDSICSIGSNSFQKKLCVDRYDSSESCDDSGLLTENSCSELSINSENSDITDPYSPSSYDSGLPSIPSDSYFEEDNLSCISEANEESYQIPISHSYCSCNNENINSIKTTEPLSNIKGHGHDIAIHNHSTNKSHQIIENTFDLFDIVPSMFRKILPSYTTCMNVGEEEESYDIIHDNQRLSHSQFLHQNKLRTKSNQSKESFVPDNKNVNNLNNCLNKEPTNCAEFESTITFKNELSPSGKSVTRFPVDRKLSLSSNICHWIGCSDHVYSISRLPEHLQEKHVLPQEFSGTFICLWDGCKVFGKPSSSKSFLERHVCTHGGIKPFYCVFDNCGQRFSSQVMLQRHVNQHFKIHKDHQEESAEAQMKLLRRNGQKIKYRRQTYSVRNRRDSFDTDITSKLHYNLVKMAKKSKDVNLNIIESKQFLHIHFEPKVIGIRQENDGNTKYLVRWYPYNSLEDEWLLKTEIVRKSISLNKLPMCTQSKYWNYIQPEKSHLIHQPRKYKPE